MAEDTIRSPFDLTLGALHGLPDVTHTKPTTVRTLTPIVGQSQTFIVQTYRQREVGDYVFIEYIDAGQTVRIVIPPAAAEVIARQRDALTGKVRSKLAKARAAEGPVGLAKIRVEDPARYAEILVKARKARQAKRVKKTKRAKG